MPCRTLMESRKRAHHRGQFTFRNGKTNIENLTHINMNKKSFLTAFVLLFASLILMPIKVSAIAILTYRAACDVYLKDGTQIRDAEFTIPKNSTFKKFTIKVEGEKRIIKSDEVDYLVVYHRKQDAQHGFVLKYITWKKGGKDKIQSKPYWALYSGGSKRLGIWDVGDAGFQVTKQGTIAVNFRHFSETLLWKEGESIPTSVPTTLFGSLKKEFLLDYFSDSPKVLDYIKNNDLPSLYSLFKLAEIYN